MNACFEDFLVLIVVLRRENWLGYPDDISSAITVCLGWTLMDQNTPIDSLILSWYITVVSPFTTNDENQNFHDADVLARR